VTGHGLGRGHHIADKPPGELAVALAAFFADQPRDQTIGRNTVQRM